MPETSNEKIFVEITLNDDISNKFESIQKTAKASADDLAKAFDDGRYKLLIEIYKQITIIDRIYDKFEKWFGIASQNFSQSFLNGWKPNPGTRVIGLDIDGFNKRLDENLKNGKISSYEHKILKERGFSGLRDYITDDDDSFLPNYYSKVKFNDKDYLSFRKRIIEEDIILFRKALGEKFDSEQYRIRENKKLFSSYFSWIRKMNPELDKSMKTEGIGSGKYEMPREEKKVNDARKIRDSIIRNQFGEVNRLNKAYLDSFTDAVGSTFHIMRIRLAEDASELERIWSGMINRMLAELQNLIAEWLVLNTIAGIFGLGTGFGAVAFESLLGIPKLAGGGDFIVPSGFPNDSYPTLVQSGERVRVTPSNSTAPETKLLSEIRDALYALNLNTASGTRQNPATLKLFLDGRELAKSLTRAKSLLSREGENL